jgi:hypothetical protein
MQDLATEAGGPTAVPRILAGLSQQAESTYSVLDCTSIQHQIRSGDRLSSRLGKLLHRQKGALPQHNIWGWGPYLQPCIHLPRGLQQTVVSRFLSSGTTTQPEGAANARTHKADMMKRSCFMAVSLALLLAAALTLQSATAQPISVSGSGCGRIAPGPPENLKAEAVSATSIKVSALK